MSINVLKLHSQQGNGVTFVDPLDPDYSVRTKTTSNTKMLDGQRTVNYVTEVIINDTYNVTIGDKVVPDALSIRIRVSGSLESHSRLKQMLSDGMVTLGAWKDEDVLLGFTPVTLPNNTTV